MHAPSVEYLIPLVIATAAAAATAPGVRGGPRWWSMFSALALGVAALLAIAAQRELWLVEHQWDAWRQERLAFVLHRAATQVPYYRDLWARRRASGSQGRKRDR